MTIYDDEFYETTYPDEVEYPSQWPTFYPNASDTVWIRRNSYNFSFSEADDTIRFNLSRELPQDKDLVVDGLELLLYSTDRDSGLTIELYLDNRKVVSVPYTLATITCLDLKSLNISEKDRTLSYRKNLMVKFKKNGSPYHRMGICCALPGHQAGHVKGCCHLGL